MNITLLKPVIRKQQFLETEGTHLYHIFVCCGCAGLDAVLDTMTQLYILVCLCDVPGNECLARRRVQYFSLELSEKLGLDFLWTYKEHSEGLSVCSMLVMGHDVKILLWNHMFFVYSPSTPMLALFFFFSLLSSLCMSCFSHPSIILLILFFSLLHL